MGPTAGNRIDDALQEQVKTRPVTAEQCNLAVQPGAGNFTTTASEVFLKMLISR
jgi:hypothetical protein